MSAPLPRGIFHLVITWIATKALFYPLHTRKAVFFFQIHLKYNKILHKTTLRKNVDKSDLVTLRYRQTSTNLWIQH